MQSSTVHPQNHPNPHPTASNVSPSQSPTARCLRVFGIVAAIVVVIVCLVVIPVVLASNRDEDNTSQPMNDSDSSHQRSTTAPHRSNETTTTTRNQSHETRTTATSVSIDGITQNNAIATIQTNPRPTATTVSTSTKRDDGTSRQMISLNGVNDTIVGLVNTTAGGSTDDFNDTYSPLNNLPRHAMDNLTSTSYVNYGYLRDENSSAVVGPGVGTGFLVIPSFKNMTVARALRFATARNNSARDPLAVTLEGSRFSNLTMLQSSSSWTLIYRGPTGINMTHSHGRQAFAADQNLSNTQSYASYRLLITSQRVNPTDAVEYSEAQIIGYVFP